MKKAGISADGKAVHLVVDGMQLGAVHELHVPNLRSEAGAPLLHPTAYYALWQMP